MIFDKKVHTRNSQNRNNFANSYLFVFASGGFCVIMTPRQASKSTSKTQDFIKQKALEVSNKVPQSNPNLSHGKAKEKSDLAVALCVLKPYIS